MAHGSWRWRCGLSRHVLIGHVEASQALAAVQGETHIANVHDSAMNAVHACSKPCAKTAPCWIRELRKAAAFARPGERSYNALS
jgi:hypothetical protein